MIREGARLACPSCGAQTVLTRQAGSPAVAPAPPPPPPRSSSSSPPPAPDRRAPREADSEDESTDYYTRALERGLAREREAKLASASKPSRPSFLLISAGILTGLSGLFWVGLGGLQVLVGLQNFNWSSFIKNVGLGGLITALGVGLIMRNQSCYQWGFGTHVINVFWVIYQIDHDRFYLGILALLLHGGALVVLLLCKSEFPEDAENAPN